MPSLKAKLMYLLFRYGHLLRFQLKRKPFDFNTSIPEFRENVEKGANFWGKIPDDFEISHVMIDNLSAEWMFPPDNAKDKIMLYFHGGIYVAGSVNAHRGIVAKFVKGSGIGALTFDYRLAPENPFPAALDDAVAAYKYLLSEGFKPENIVFVGDSAGGGLCMATMLALKGHKIPLPVAAVALSPWTDLKVTGKSHQFNEKKSLAPVGCATVCSKYYAGGNDPGNPLISPLYGDLEGLPPLSLYAGSYETLLDDSRMFAEKAKKAGLDVTLEVGEKMFHCYPACAPMFPEATRAMNDICAFIRKHLKS